jgi:hypothetical protein
MTTTTASAVMATGERYGRFCVPGRGQRGGRGRSTNRPEDLRPRPDNDSGQHLPACVPLTTHRPCGRATTVSRRRSKSDAREPGVDGDGDDRHRPAPIAGVHVRAHSDKVVKLVHSRRLCHSGRTSKKFTAHARLLHACLADVTL